MKTVFIYIPGILTFPGSGNWVGKAVTWTMVNQPEEGGCQHFAEKVEYLAGPISRAFSNGKRAKKLVRTLSFYDPKEWRIVLAAHSNGCDVVLDALKMADWPPIAEIHLISGACEASFQKNGLNDADNVGAIWVYVAGKDFPLRLAGGFLARKLLGYGTLGAKGPLHVARTNVNVVTRHTFGHGDWFTDANLDDTMCRITGNYPK